MLGLLLAAAVEVSAVSDVGQKLPPRNSLWVWHQMPATALVRLANRFRVGRLLIWVSPGFTASPATLTWIRQLHRAAARRQIALDALCGDPSWAIDPEPARAWAQEVASTHAFSRLHLDIEPHALPMWAEASADLTTGIVTAITAAAAADLPVDVDIPAWYWTVKTLDGQTADVAITQAADGITLMSYQDTSDKIVDISLRQMRTALAAGKPVTIGVNLAQPVEDTPDSSLWGQSPQAIRACLDAVAAKAANWPGFTGVAIHEAESLNQLP